MAVEAGASALGLVSHMPSGPGVISDEQIAETAATVPPPIATFLLTSRQWVPDIVEQQRFCRTNTIQICDHLTQGTHRNLKNALPGISVVQVIHVTGCNPARFRQPETRGQGIRRHGQNSRLDPQSRHPRTHRHPAVFGGRAHARERSRGHRTGRPVWPRSVFRRAHQWPTGCQQTEALLRGGARCGCKICGNIV